MLMTEEWTFHMDSSGKIESVGIVSRNEPDLYPEYVLQVSRPTVNQSVAIVTAGGNPTPLIGHIETRIWRRQAEKVWIETDEILSSVYF